MNNASYAKGLLVVFVSLMLPVLSTSSIAANPTDCVQANWVTAKNMGDIQINICQHSQNGLRNDGWIYGIATKPNGEIFHIYCMYGGQCSNPTLFGYPKGSKLWLVAGLWPYGDATKSPNLHRALSYLAGYKFDHWEVNGELYSRNTQIFVTTTGAPITINAYYTYTGPCALGYECVQ